ncbi:uncharacterized protein DUF955 [Mumia flava]|uniref:Uncharacterized protein DUF955 n=1 Tax=Mumia flava TaxID=1348852 RepID=A0A0B2BLA0_9ACTN|nr:ImmA/IrrE family metallo-endopeptidase [Mumia flava]PJJ54027.1 uncharacterized protein DUF955 [Mumia flava]
MSNEHDGRLLAQQFRDESELGNAPIRDLIDLVDSRCGVDVAIVPAEADEHGMTVSDPQRRLRMIAVATTTRPMRQRSTIAHELGHVLADDCAPAAGNGWAERSDEEIRADAFARHLLVPITALKGRFPESRPLTEADLSYVVRIFGASPMIAAIQLYGAGLIDDRTKSSWKLLTTPALASRFGWRDEYTALQAESRTPRPPRRLTAWATEGYIEGVVSIETVARVRGLSTDEVRAEFADARIEPRPAVPPGAPLSAFSRDVDLSELDDDG